MQLIIINNENFLQTTRQSTAGESINQLLTVQQIVNDFLAVFKSELGRFPGEVHLEVDENATSAVAPKRRIPVKLKKKFKDELDRLEDLNVIAKIDEPTPWVSKEKRSTESVYRPKTIKRSTEKRKIPVTGDRRLTTWALESVSVLYSRFSVEILALYSRPGVQSADDVLRREEVKYMGHVFSHNGLKIDPDKVAAVIEMLRSTDVEAAQRQNGFVKYQR